MLSHTLRSYISGDHRKPLFISGDALTVLGLLPDESIDTCMTSPPYWRKRQYHGGGIGQEPDYREYIEALLRILAQVKRVLKPQGSLWLNIGDTYLNKRLLGLPWRLALAMMDEQGWILRNDVVWNKVKGGFDTAPDRLRNVHEYVFHFVKRPRGYYYNLDAIRSKPRQARIVNGAVVSATGVTGVKYRRQIELSTALNEREKREALDALDSMLEKVRSGELSDFRMVIRGQQRVTHSSSEKVSGRAREIRSKGFYFLTYHPNGSKPGDVWDILPEDTQHRAGHFAAYPEDLCRIPILATCPPDGIVLDPFCGTGTTMLVAYQLGRRSIGIDIAPEYIEMAKRRWESNGPRTGTLWDTVVQAEREPTWVNRSGREIIRL